MSAAKFNMPSTFSIPLHTADPGAVHFASMLIVGWGNSTYHSQLGIMARWCRKNSPSWNKKVGVTVALTLTHEVRRIFEQIFADDGVIGSKVVIIITKHTAYPPDCGSFS